MATNAVCGNSGEVLVSTHVVAEIGNWSLTIDRSPTAVPKYGTTTDYLLCTPYMWSGSFSGNWYYDDTVGQTALHTALTGGTTVALHLSVDGTDEYSGTAYITQISSTTPYDGIVSVSFNYQGSGALTMPT